MIMMSDWYWTNILEHIILIPCHPVFAVTPESDVLSGRATHTNCIVFWFHGRVLDTPFTTLYSHVEGTFA